MLFITGSPHNIQSVLSILQIELKNTIEYSSLRNQLD